MSKSIETTVSVHAQRAIEMAKLLGSIHDRLSAALAHIVDGTGYSRQLEEARKAARTAADNLWEVAADLVNFRDTPDEPEMMWSKELLDPAEHATDDRGVPVRVGDLVYDDGNQVSGVVLTVAHGQVIYKYADDDGDYRTYSVGDHQVLVALPEGDERLALVKKEDAKPETTDREEVAA